MTIEDIRAERLSNPWGLDDLDLADKEQQEIFKEAHKELNKHYAIVFNTPSGKKVLKHLKKCTLDQPTWIPNPQNGESAVQHGFIREGQNSIVRSIIDRISLTNKKSK